MEENMEIEAAESSLQHGLPHEALFLVLAYLPLYELLLMSQICRSLKGAVENDILPWLNIVVGKPINKRFTDNHLLKATSKAKERLRSLILLNCSKITDDGLQKVAANNPHISTLHLPACTALTPGGVIEAMNLLTVNNHRLKSLRINGIYDLKKEDLQILHYLIGENRTSEKQEPRLYHEFRNFNALKHEEAGCLIDVDICPKCEEVRVVYDCPRDSCRSMRQKNLVACRGCSLCIPRCEECGICIKDEEPGEAACADALCLYCWLQLPKCSFCNKPYCNQHADRKCFLPGSTGFICADCSYDLR